MTGATTLDLSALAPLSQRLTADYLEFNGVLPLRMTDQGVEVATWLPEVDPQVLDDLRFVFDAEPEFTRSVTYCSAFTACWESNWDSSAPLLQKNGRNCQLPSSDGIAEKAGGRRQAGVLLWMVAGALKDKGRDKDLVRLYVRLAKVAPDDGTPVRFAGRFSETPGRPGGSLEVEDSGGEGAPRGRRPDRVTRSSAVSR